MRPETEKILIFDFGGQYAHLIARRVRERGYAPEIVLPKSIRQIDASIKGIIFSGGARSVYRKGAPTLDPQLLRCRVPTLGICYGHQLLAHLLGGRVAKGAKGEYGPARLAISRKSLLFRGVANPITVWMNHRDSVIRLPSGFSILASTANTPIAAFADERRHLYGVQFHPEVSHTKLGNRILSNFLASISEKSSHYHTLEYDSGRTDEIRAALEDEKAVVGLSGGVDSATAALLVSHAIGKRLLAVYVDTGLMRAGETKEVRQTFKKFPLRLKVVSAASRFFRVLKGVTDPEAKRKRIGRLFVKIFEEEARKFKADVLIQGTIYSDRIESGATKYSSRIKSHHNVGGLPKRMKLKIYEPLKELYKDEVRKLAAQLGLPPSIIQRKPFPGPGLAIRIVGEVTPEKVRIVRQADAIIQQELGGTKYMKNLWMAFPVLLSLKSVGVRGDERSYQYPIVLRLIESQDVMTANFARIPYAVLANISTRLTNEIPEINRVVYDISNKPPATMEWE